MSVTLIVILAALFVLFLMRAGITQSDLDSLENDRKAKGAKLIELRNECHAEGWKDDGTFDDKWAKANDAYNDSVRAEESANEQFDRQQSRANVANQIAADADRIQSRKKGRIRPDYNPSDDRRASGSNGHNNGFPTSQEWGRALRVWSAFHMPEFEGASEDDMRIMRKCRVNPMAPEFRLPTGPAVMAMILQCQEVLLSRHPDHGRAALNEVWASWNTMTPQDGGYVTEPPQVLRQLEINQLLWGGLLQVATVKTTTVGGDIILPFTDDTTVKGRRISEDGPIGVENNPKFGLMRWGEYKYTSDLIIVTYEMTRDSFIGLEDHIGEVGGQRLGRVQNDEFTNGDGVGKPRGLVFAAPIGKTTASGTAITTDEVIDLEGSVDDAYIQGGQRVGYMMHKNITTYLRKLKDLEGRPFYILGQETGGRDRLNNKPIFINYSMSGTLATGNDVMTFGDHAKYWVRRVGGTRLVRDPYTYRISRDAEAFAALQYADGNLVNAGTAPVKKMRMGPP